MSEYLQPRIAATDIGPSAGAIRLAEEHAGGFSISFGLVLLFLIALYSQAALQVPALEAAGLMNVIGGAAIAAVIAQSLLHRRGVALAWPESYLLLAFVGAAGLSCLAALWPRYALDNTLDLLKYVSLYFLILHTVDNERRLHIVLWTLVLGALFPAVGALKNYVAGNLVEGRSRWIGIFANPNELAYSLVILVPLVAYLAFVSRTPAKIFLWLILAVYTAAVFVSFSRGGMLGLLVVAVLLGQRWRSAPVLLLALLMLAAGAAFMTYGWTRGEGFTDLGSDLNFQQRLATFQAGFAMFADHPLTGVGLGCSLIAWPLYAPSDLYTRGWLVIHNTFVQALSETGMIGFLSFTVLLGAALRKARRIARHAAEGDVRTVRLGSALAVALWGFIVCGLSGGYVLTWFPYILLAVVSSAAMVVKNVNPRLSSC